MPRALSRKGPAFALAAASCALSIAAAGCFSPPSSTARLADSAYELNTATRFGRMDVALEHVAAASRDDFSQRHAAWGKLVRVVDLEFGGIAPRKDGADVVVTVTWQRPNDAIVRTTSIAQKWTESRGNWFMVSEEEQSGDKGLLALVTKKDAKAAKKDGEAPPEAAPAPEAARPPARVQTRVIYEE